MHRPIPKSTAPRPLLVLATLGLLFAACGPAQQVESEAPTPVVFAMQPYLSYGPFYVAQAEGYFEAKGLDVSFVQLPGASELALALAQGDVDAGATFLSVGLLNAMADGADVRIVSDKGFLNPDGCSVNAVLALRDLVEQGSLDTADGWRGARVAMDPTTIEAYVLDLLISPLGLDEEDIVPVDLPPPVELDAFAEGTLQVTLTSEPWLTRFLNAGDVLTYQPMESLIPGFQFAMNVFGPSLLQQDRQAGTRFITAYLQAVRQLEEGKTERNLELLAEFTQLEPELLEQVCWPSFRPDGHADVDSILSFYQWAQDAGLASKDLSAEQIYDPTFVDQANRILDSAD